MFENYKVYGFYGYFVYIFNMAFMFSMETIDNALFMAYISI